jgi:hypothetical protein
MTSENLKIYVNMTLESVFIYILEGVSIGNSENK